jgi:hypothetical protein
MGSNHVEGEQQTKLTLQNNCPQQNGRVLEGELEKRMEELNKLLPGLQEAVAHESFSDKRHAIDFVTDLRLKIKTCYEIFRVARLLREPARESMLLKLRDGLDTLQEVFESRLGIKIN